MQNDLYILRENTAGPQERYRGTYPLRMMEYELSRTTDRKGRINSEVQGGRIRVVIEGFADSLLMAWLFDATRKEDGAIITLDEHERGVEKMHFNRASAVSFRMNYDSKTKAGVTMELIIQAKEIATDKDLYFESR